MARRGARTGAALLAAICVGLAMQVDAEAQGTEVPRAPDTGSIVRLDPALDAIVAPDAKLEILKADAFGIAEGPVWVREGKSGYLLFSDIAANVIYKWTPDGQVSVFLKDSGYTGDLAKISLEGYLSHSGPLFVYTFGSNGITLDAEGRVVFCAQGDRAIIRLEKDGTRTILADRFEGKRLNRPNDLVVKADGTVYFTDVHPNTPTIEMPFAGVFMLKNGKIQVITNDFVPNGIAFSPDEKVLYVNGNLYKGSMFIGNMGIRRYDVRADGTVENGRVFVDMSADKAIGGPDGMKVDRDGNVYCTGPGGIWIMAPDGKHLGTILLAEPATNLAFGDADYKTLYITDRRSLARIRLRTPGISPGPSL
ncbi:MAG: SMP-30/gluconolactonase/LRE family protein [Pseudomonadota bacterium]|nr:SMP-30/gluconolactonase/LRE family protein [Pseudomonadota bacterium]